MRLYEKQIRVNKLNANIETFHYLKTFVLAKLKENEIPIRFVITKNN